MQSSSAATWEWRHRDLDPLRCLFIITKKKSLKWNFNFHWISIFIEMKFSLTEITKVSETFLECMRSKQGLRTPLLLIFRVLFCLLLVLTNQFTQTCHFTQIITWCLAHFPRTWFMLQISGRKVNIIKLTAPSYHHQLSERRVTILQASEYSCPRRPPGLQLHSYNLGTYFLPMLYENLPEIKGHMYLLFLSLEVPHQSSSSELVTHFPSKVAKKQEWT